MKRLLTFVMAAFAATALVAADVADAKRMGGGRSLGTQRQSIAPTPPSTPSATPAAPSGAATTPAMPGAAPNPVMPATPGAAAAARPATAGAAAPAAGGASRWLGPIAGIAAGLGLAALLSHFGLPEGLGTFLLLALLAIAVIFVVRMLFARRKPMTRPLQYAGAGATGAAVPGYEPPLGPTWGGAPAASSGPATSTRAFPPGFDAAAFVRQAKLQFHRLQAAYDRADRKALAEVMTPAMLAEIERDLAARGEHRPTEVVTLDAEVLEAGSEGSSHHASVRFRGLLREDGASTPQPFDEVWNLTKPVDDSSGWLLAGIQQLSPAQ